MIQTVGIIGSGNVAWHLAHALQALPTVKLTWIYSRNAQTLAELGTELNVFTSTTLPSSAVDLILVCVNDDSIQTIVSQLP
ncbi:MAG TPA: NAD(P)-binding domain-containing protein, partial [Taishania sp.]|nr:NAD(P)-binding domain-containing protein [Taishania sp.]